MPIYAMTTTQGFDDDENPSNLSDTDNNIEGGSPSDQDMGDSDSDDEDIERNSRDSGGEGMKKKFKKNTMKNAGRKRGLSGAA